MQLHEVPPLPSADGDGDDVAFVILENFGWRNYEHSEPKQLQSLSKLLLKVKQAANKFN